MGGCGVWWGMLQAVMRAMGSHGEPWGAVGSGGEPWGAVGSGGERWGAMGSHGERQMKLHSLPAAHLLLCSQVPNRPRTGASSVAWGLGTPVLWSRNQSQDPNDPPSAILLASALAIFCPVLHPPCILAVPPVNTQTRPSPEAHISPNVQ